MKYGGPVLLLVSKSVPDLRMLWDYVLHVNKHYQQREQDVDLVRGSVE